MYGNDRDVADNVKAVRRLKAVLRAYEGLLDRGDWNLFARDEITILESQREQVARLLKGRLPRGEA